MSLFIESLSKGKIAKNSLCRKIISAVEEIAEDLTSDTTPSMKLDDMVFQFIEKNPGTTTTKIQNNFLEYNQPQKLQYGPNGISSTDYVSFSLETSRRNGKIVMCSPQTWFTQEYVENIQAQAEAKRVQAEAERAHAEKVVRKKLEILQTEKLISEQKFSDWQNKIEEKLGFSPDSITLGGDD